MENEWIPSWIRGGRVLETAWINRNVLAWCSGMHVVFYNIPKRSQMIWQCSSQDSGEGAYCLSAHLTMNVFAYAEKVLEPKILVLAYPSMAMISQCAGGCSNEYLATAFVGDEHLLSLSSYPNFSVVVWSWRTGDKLTTVESWITDAKNYSQCLRVFNRKPALIAQLGLVSGQICIWEMTLVSKTTVLKNCKVILPNRALAQGVDWCPDHGEALLAITDTDGHVYLSNQDGSAVKRVVLSQRCGVCLEIEPAAICWFQDGIVLKTTFCQIRFYKKVKNRENWHLHWYTETHLKPCVLTSHPTSKNRIVYFTREGYLVQISFPGEQTQPVSEVMLFYGAKYTQLEFVYPWCHHLVAVDNLTEISLLEIYGGTELKRINTGLNGDLASLVSHLQYPLLAMTSRNGEFSLMSLLNPQEPLILGKYYLQRTELHIIRFSQCGRFILVADRKLGNCYCINLCSSKTVSIVAVLETHRQISDVILYSEESRLKLYVLFVTSRQTMTGHQILLYTLNEGSSEFIDSNKLIVLGHSYENLWFTPSNSSLILGIPFLSRHINVLSIKNWSDVKKMNMMTSGHQLRLAKLYVDNNWITSSGPDGFSIIGSDSRCPNKIILMLHHRKDGGTAKTVVNPFGTIVVSLGVNGSIVAVKCRRKSSNNIISTGVKFDDNVFQVYVKEYEAVEQKVINDYNSLDSSIVEMLSYTFKASNEMNENITWLESMSKDIVAKEVQMYAETKSEIQTQFASLRARIVRLLDINETCPEMERLPVSIFDLNVASRDRKMKVAKDERANVQQEIEAKCNCMDEIAKWIKTKFWDSQTVLGKSLLSMSGKREVTNYTLTATKTDVSDYLMYSRFCKELDTAAICPYRLYTNDRFSQELENQVRLRRATEKQKMEELLAGEEDDTELNSEEVENFQAMEGTTTHYFINQPGRLYSQFELYAYTQNLVDAQVAVNDCKMLRLHFNKLFDDMYAIKERELSLAREKINRLRYIDSELRLMFGQSVSGIPLYPEWHYKERPENIVKVEDRDIEVTQYVSPSLQEILGWQEAETERIRKMDADDFRERALMSMMNGVLQIRWEDTIKKDIPKPNFILTKQPDQYTAEEKAIVARYEQEAENLNNDRERYRRILVAEYAKLMDSYEESVAKFESRHQELYQIKLKIEAAILQLNLRMMRANVRHVRHVESLREDDAVIGKIVQDQNTIHALMKQLQLLQAINEQLSARHATLIGKRKMLEKKLKSDVSSVGKAAFKLLQRLYKKQPRTVLKNSSASNILDLQESIATSRKVPYLLSECVDYMRALDIMDVRPTKLPPSIDDSVWKHFVALRRVKIQLELEIQTTELQIDEITQIVMYFEKKIGKCRSQILSGHERRKEIRQKKIDFDLDIEVQLVLKTVQVEIPCSGNHDDAEGAVFIPRQEVEAVNRVVQAVGEKKLNTMDRTVSLHRNAMLKEWRHECLKMRMRDLHEEISQIHKIPVTKEILRMLQQNGENLNVVKIRQKREDELDGAEKNIVKMLRQWQKKLRCLELKIEATKRENDEINKLVTEKSVTRRELEGQRDLETETKGKQFREKRMKILRQKANLIRKIQENQKEIETLRKTREPHGKLRDVFTVVQRMPDRHKET